MNKKIIIQIFPMMALVCACQSETPKEIITQKCDITVRAILPGSDDTRAEFTIGDSDLNTRAQITYGNTDPSKEIFMWNMEDEIFVFNISKLDECPEGVRMGVSKIDGKNAEFTPYPAKDQYDENFANFRIEPGDIIYINYNETLRAYGKQGSTLVEKQIFTVTNAGSENNAPQLVVKNPTDESLTYMQNNLKMYAIVTATENNKIPDAHFKHLSTILRVTLKNKTDKYLVPKELMFEYPETKSFFESGFYCSVDTESPNGSGLTIYDTEYDYNNINGYLYLKGTDPYTDFIGSSINNYTAAATEKGDSIAPGDSYDLYITGVPRIANSQRGNKLNIRFAHRLTSDKSQWYDMTLEGYDKPFEAGLRYWFKLTACEDENGNGILMLNSQWNALHPEDK